MLHQQMSRWSSSLPKDGVTGQDAGSQDVTMEEPETCAPSSSSKGIQKSEFEEEEGKVGVEETPAPRRRPIKLGSAHLHILRAVADADAANWSSLQAAIDEANESGRAKSELVGRLSQLAEARLASKEAAMRKADEHVDHARKVADAENNYRAGLDEEMIRLEKFNPVGPRSNVPLISGERLTREIAEGKPIWQARRDHRARERAARHRKIENAEARKGLSANQANEGPLFDKDPSEGGQALDDELARRSREELKAFRRALKEEDPRTSKSKPRKPDSERRRKLKKQRRKERKRNKRDDAERDSNHAIAHSLAHLTQTAGGHFAYSMLKKRHVASFSPGLLITFCCQVIGNSHLVHALPQMAWLVTLFAILASFTTTSTDGYLERNRLRKRRGASFSPGLPVALCCLVIGSSHMVQALPQKVRLVILFAILASFTLRAWQPLLSPNRVRRHGVRQPKHQQSPTMERKPRQCNGLRVPVASFSPRYLFGLCSWILTMGASAQQVATEEATPSGEEEALDALPVLFGILLACFAMMAFCQSVCCPMGHDRPRSTFKHGQLRRVGGARKKVRFRLPRASPRVATEVPFLGGPRAAKRQHPIDKPHRFATIQGRHEYEQEGFALLRSRYSQSTANSYKSQFAWWTLFCRRRGEEPIRYITSYDRQEEQLVLDYLVHCSTNESKAPGTIKLRLAAIRHALDTRFPRSTSTDATRASGSSRYPKAVRDKGKKKTSHSGNAEVARETPSIRQNRRGQSPLGSSYPGILFPAPCLGVP